MDGIGGRLGGGPAGGEVAVAEGAQRLPEPLARRVEAVVGQGPGVHRPPRRTGATLERRAPRGRRRPRRRPARPGRRPGRLGPPLRPLRTGRGGRPPPRPGRPRPPRPAPAPPRAAGRPPETAPGRACRPARAGRPRPRRPRRRTARAPRPTPARGPCCGWPIPRPSAARAPAAGGRTRPRWGRPGRRGRGGGRGRSGPWRCRARRPSRVSGGSAGSPQGSVMPREARKPATPS